MKIRSYLFLIALSLFSMSMAVRAELRIYELKHQLASSLIPVIGPIVGDRGTVTGMHNQLIVQANPQTLAEVESIIQELDSTRVNRKIQIRFQNALDQDDQAIEAEGVIRSGHISLRNGSNKSITNGSVRIRDYQLQSQQNLTQSLMLLDGQTGFIQVGEQVPFTEEWRVLAQDYALITQTIVWQDITTGFAVKTQTIGNEVMLEIVPRIAKRGAGNSVEFTSLSTSIRIPLGTWVNLGDIMQNNDQVSRKILGQASVHSHQTGSLFVKVE